jgi:hypothetical protein
VLICPTAKAEYFSAHDWTPQITLQSLANLVFARIAPKRVSRPFDITSPVGIGRIALGDA